MDEMANHGFTVTFVGGPWDEKTTRVDHIVAPVFGPGHEIGNHYWLDTESDPPTYHWDGVDWEIIVGRR